MFEEKNRQLLINQTPSIMKKKVSLFVFKVIIKMKTIYYIFPFCQAVRVLGTRKTDFEDVFSDKMFLSRSLHWQGDRYDAGSLF